MDVVIAANAFCIRVHCGQNRFSGSPFCEHPQAVRQALVALCDACDLVPSGDLQAAALLHDVIEMAGVAADEIALEFNEQVAHWVFLLSKPPLDVGNTSLRDDAYYQRLQLEKDDLLCVLHISECLHDLAESHLGDVKHASRCVKTAVRRVLPLALDLQDSKLQKGATAALIEAIATAAKASNLPIPILGTENPAMSTVQSALPPGLCGVVEVSLQISLPVFLAHVEQLAIAGVQVFLLRNKGLSAGAVLQYADALLQLCQKKNLIFLMQDRADLAWVVGAHGVHLEQTGLLPSRVRPLCPPGFLVGGAVHSDSQIRAQFEREQNLPGLHDYIAVGPIFPSRSEGCGADLGLVALSGWLQESPLPLVAFGGIDTPLRVANVGRAGVHMAACFSAFQPAKSGERSVYFQARLFAVSFFAGRALRGMARKKSIP